MGVRLLLSGIEVDAWSRHGGSTTSLVDLGATAYDVGAADAAKDADAVITMLPTGEATADVMFRQLALQAMRPKSTWIQMATIGVEVTEHLVTEARIRRPRVTFVVLASGPQRVAGRGLESVFKPFGPATLWLGPADVGKWDEARG